MAKKTEFTVKTNSNRIKSALWTRIGSVAWLDSVFDEETIKYLSTIIEMADENPELLNHELAGNLTRSNKLIDEHGWFYNNVLKEHVEIMFYAEHNNWYEAHIKKHHGPVKFLLDELWVNYQKQHEFNPVHRHWGEYSFVIFMNIPYHWQEQQERFVSNSNRPGCLEFVWSEKDSTNIDQHSFFLSQEDKGRMIFFPADLNHQVYPFYGTEDTRITISGNIIRA